MSCCVGQSSNQHKDLNRHLHVPLAIYCIDYLTKHHDKAAFSLVKLNKQMEATLVAALTRLMGDLLKCN